MDPNTIQKHGFHIVKAYTKFGDIVSILKICFKVLLLVIINLILNIIQEILIQSQRSNWTLSLNIKEDFAYEQILQFSITAWLTLTNASSNTIIT